MASDDTFTPVIPDQSGNPFIVSSTLPEGTLFIVFGSILGGLAVVVLVWRLVNIWQGRRAANTSISSIAESENKANGEFPATDTLGKTKYSRLAAPPTNFFSPTYEAMAHGSMLTPTGTTSLYFPTGHNNSQSSSTVRLRPPSFVRDGTSHRRSVQFASNSLPAQVLQQPKPRQRPPSEYLEELLRKQ